MDLIKESELNVSELLFIAMVNPLKITDLHLEIELEIVDLLMFCFWEVMVLNVSFIHLI